MTTAPTRADQMKIPKNPRTSHINHWPTLRRFMDEALDAPRGIRLHHINGSPLTVGRASDIRNVMGKIRKSDQRKNQIDLDPADPAYGQSPYNALTFIVMPNLADAAIHITWHWPGTDLPWEDWLTTSIEHMPENARKLCSACDISITLPRGGAQGQTFEIRSAPTFAKGWQAIRSQLPAWLDILNTYNVVADDDFEILGLASASQPQPVHLQTLSGN